MLSNLVVGYLFLGGAAGGACLVLALMGLLSPRSAIAAVVVKGHGAFALGASFPAGVRSASASWHGASQMRPSGVSFADASAAAHYVFCPPAPYRRLFASCYTATLVALAVGLVCLTADLARADRVLLLFTSPTSSLVAIGSWCLVACLVLAASLLALWGGAVKGVPLVAMRVLQAVSGVAGFAVALYTGLLLQSLNAVPLWATPWLPVLFTLSSCSCGLVLIVLAAHLGGSAQCFSGVLRRLLASDAVLLVLEGAAMALVIFSSQTASDTSAITPTSVAGQASAQELLFGDNAWLFWGVFVLVGLVVPFAFECLCVYRRVHPSGALLLAGACVLVGGLAMRYCIVAAGMHPVAVTAAALVG